MKFHYFFDLDGTLTDSAPGILNSVQHALRAFQVARSREALLAFVGPPLAESFAGVLGGDPARVARAIALYRSYYGRKGIFENALYAGVADMLRAVRRAGHATCLATSKPEPYARRILGHFGIAGLFDHVAGAEMHGPRNSKADVLRHGLALCGRPDPGRCLMVGDRSYDVLGAHALGMPCAGVLYGYGTREELETAGADWLCGDVPALRALLLSA